MNKAFAFCILGLSLMVLSLHVYAQNKNETEMQVELLNTSGKDTGQAFLTKTNDGVLIRVEAQGLSPGWHGVHIHKVGDCSDYTHAFKKSSDHLAEPDSKHGFLNDDNRHEGDLPNLWVHKDGTAKAEYFTEDFDFDDLLDQDGSALMIHAKPDDYKSQPSGNSGDRIACGVIKK